MKLSKRLKKARNAAEFDKIIENATHAKRAPNIARRTEKRPDGSTAIVQRPSRG